MSLTPEQLTGRHFVLRDRKIVPATLMEWAQWFEAGNRKIARTELGPRGVVSTVFLGLDHGSGNGPPILFETLVFGGPLDDEMERYSTLEEAEAGHAAMVERLREPKP